MTVQQYWIGKLAVVEWALTDLDSTPVDDATVTGIVTLPDLTTAAMTVTAPVTDSGGPYRLSYDPATSGLFAYRVEATGTVTDAEEGTFQVRPSLVGAPTITTDPTTTVGAIRLIVSDVDVASPLFTDAEIGAFYAMSGSNVRLGAAQAYEAIAGNELLVSKVIRTLDLQTDGAKVATEFRALAKSLRDQADNYDPDGNLFGMGVIDYRPDRWLFPEHEATEPEWCG